MKSRTALWETISISTIRVQARFAQNAYKNTNEKLQVSNAALFSSIHSFLTHCSVISKILKSRNGSLQIQHLLRVPNNSPIHERSFRNSLDHIDERINELTQVVDRPVLNGVVSPKRQLPEKVQILMHFDPETKIFRLFDEELVLDEMMSAVDDIGLAADRWLKANNFDKHNPNKLKELGLPNMEVGE